MPDKLPFTDDDDDTNREKPDYGESADLSEIESLTQDPYSSPTDPSLSESVDTAQSGFPSQAWTTLNNCLSMTKWVVPVLPDSQLETLLKASIELAKLGKDTDCSMCKDFYSFGLLTSFYKTFQDGAVDGWDCQILHYIYMNALLAIELCAIKAADDCLPILELQSILFSPDSRFQQHSMYPTNICWKIQHGEKTNGTLRYTHLTPLLPHLLAKTPGELATFAPLNSESSRLKAYFSSQSRRHLIPILSDFINLFGRLGGFDRLLSRFTRFAELDHFPASLVAAYLHPFSRCCDYLHSGVLQTYFVPIVDIVVPRFSKLIETSSTGNHKSDLKSDSFAELSFNLRCLLLRMPERKNLLEQLDMFCLNLILRHLQYASFNKRMTALNDLNSLFLRLSPSDVCYAPLVQTPIVDPLTIEHVANWMHEKQVLTLILRENLHQPQYVERVERIIRFMIKLKYLTEDDLGRIWESQDGKHEAISKNVFDMLARLALEFTPDQLDYLFRRVQQCWSIATKRRREQLIDLMCRLAEEDRGGLMAQKVLSLLWEMAVDVNSSTDITDLALKAHAKILDHSISDVGDKNRFEWVIKLIAILNKGPVEPLLVPAIKQFIEICNLVPTKLYSSQIPYRVCNPRMRDLHDLNASHNLLKIAVENVVESMRLIHAQRVSSPDPAKGEHSSSRQISLQMEVKELLGLIRYLLSEGSFTFHLDWMRDIWLALMTGPHEDDVTDSSVYPEDREICYQWFSSLPPDTITLRDFTSFFDAHILSVDPSHMTSSGMILFQTFFYRINVDQRRLLDVAPATVSSSQFHFLMNDADLHGLDHLWRMLLDAPYSIAQQAANLLELLYSHLSSCLSIRRHLIYEDLVRHCFSLLRADYNTASALVNADADDSSDELKRTVERIVLIIRLVRRFFLLDEPSEKHGFRRLPLKRSWIGPSILFTVSYCAPSADPRISLPTEKSTHPLKMCPSELPSNLFTCPTIELSPHNTFMFTAHLNMTIGELRSHLLHLCLRSLQLKSVHMCSSPQTTIPSGQTFSDPHQFRIELYVVPSTVTHASSNVPVSFTPSSNLISSEANSDSILTLLPLAPNWPSAFLNQAANWTPISVADSTLPTINLSAFIMSTNTGLSFEFKRDSQLNLEPKEDAPTSSQMRPPANSSGDPAVSHAEGSASNGKSPSSDSVTHSKLRTGDPDLTAPERRSDFLLQMAKLALSMNNGSFLACVVDVLLSMPVPESLAERLRLDISSCASIHDSNRSHNELKDWVTVQLPNHMPLADTHLGRLLSSKYICTMKPAPEDLCQLMELYYTLQVLYSLCLPTSAATDCYTMMSLFTPEIHTSCGDPQWIPTTWIEAGKFTFQLLRAGLLSELLSCSLLSKLSFEQNPQSCTNSVQLTIVQLIRLWLSRLIRLLYIVCAFTVWKNYSSLDSSDRSSNSELLCQSAARLTPLCDSLKCVTLANDPIVGGDYFVISLAYLVSQIALTQQVTATEIRTLWLPDPCTCAPNLIWLICRCASDWHFTATEADRKVTPCNPELLSPVSPTALHSERDFDTNDRLSAVSQSRDSDSPNEVNRHRHRGQAYLVKQTSQVLEGNDTVCSTIVEFMASLPFCLALSPCDSLSHSGKTDPPVPHGLDSDIWLNFIQDLLFSPSEFLRHASLFHLSRIATLHHLVSSSAAAPTASPPIPIIRLLFYLLKTHVPLHITESNQFFKLVTLLLRHTLHHKLPFEEVTQLLSQQAEWIRNSILDRKLSDDIERSPVEGLSPSSDVSSPHSGTDGSRLSLRATQDLLLSGNMHICSVLLAFAGPSPPDPDGVVTPVSPMVSPLFSGITPFEQRIIAPLMNDIIQSLLLPSKVQDDVTAGANLGGCLPDHLLASTFDLLLALVKRGPSNVHRLSHMFCRLWFPDEFSLSTYPWDYAPPAVSEFSTDSSHFVGLRNGGATCYMNAILQQLFSLLPIRNTVLAARPELRLAQEISLDGDPIMKEAAAFGSPCLDEMLNQRGDAGGLRSQRGSGNHDCMCSSIMRLTSLSQTPPAPNATVQGASFPPFSSTLYSGRSLIPRTELATKAFPYRGPTVRTASPTPTSECTETVETEPKKHLTTEQIHQLRLLFHLQSIFGHLTHSLLRSYTPVDFWHEFKFSSEHVKLSEQHDALEFLQTLGNDVDESLHLCGMPKAIEEILGGTFADQKLCIDCPHRYSRTESFTTLNVDIRNNHNLLQSLEQYVKGDRLEGDNAYRCEACDKKVTTLKRMCIDRLPLVLVIQLKRFDYDWDKGIAIKFNDYFEFPRELDMRPYTVHGLVNHLPDSTQDQPDGDGLDDSHCESSQSAKSEEQSATHYTRYTLRGVVVHSGQASGGHYYSFIRQFCPKSRQYKWYKYDDSEVTLSSVDDEDEARLAWFGGDVNPSTCDSSKYLYVWDSKRIWNAYVLFYEREDFHPNMGCGSLKEFTVTQRLKRMVHLENMDYLHQQLQFHPLLALFIRNLIEASLDMCKMRPEVVEDLGLTTLKLLVNFSFAVRFQQVAREWYIWTPLFLRLMSLCPLVREKFVQWTIFSSPDRVCELLFECPYPEVRFLFAIAILYILSFDSSTACQSSVTCLKAFERARDRISSSDLPASTDRSDFAQAESAKTILSSIRCSKVSTKDGALCPSLSDIIVQVISLQLCASPANFLRRDFNNKITASDKLSDSTGWLTSPNEGACGSSYTRTHTDVTHHPLVYRQFFSIFMDYACFGEDARARLLILGVPELLIKYALKNSLTSVSMSSWFTYSSISSAGIRNPEVLKRYLTDMLNSLPAHLDSTLPTALPPFPVVTASRDSLLLAFKSYQASGTSAYAIGSATSHSPVASSIQYSATVTLWCLLSLLVRSLDVSSHCTEQEKLVRISPCTASRSNIEAGHKSLALVDEADASVAQLDIPSVNPYQIGQAPLCPITSSLADLLLTTTCNRFISCFLRSWLNVSTVEHISNVLMFLSFKNLEFSSIAIDSLVWAFKTCRSDSGLVLSVLQSLLTVEDTFKIDRLRYALTGADGTGLMVPTPVTTCHQSFSHYTKVIKMVMGLILNDLQVQRLFQSEDSFIEWLHRWIETIGDSLQNPTSLSYWHSPGTRSPQSHDDFVLMMRRVYEVLPIPDDDQAGSSDESNGVSYDEDDGGQSSGSHYENSLDQVGFERLTRSWRRDTEETKFELQPPPTKHRISESANYVPDDTVDSDSLDRSP